MSLILGLDGGGTKTLAAVAQRDGTVIGLIRGEGLDPTAAPDWRERLRDLIGRLGREPRDLAAAVLGLKANERLKVMLPAEEAILTVLSIRNPTQMELDRLLTEIKLGVAAKQQVAAT